MSLKSEEKGLEMENRTMRLRIAMTVFDRMCVRTGIEIQLQNRNSRKKRRRRKYVTSSLSFVFGDSDDV